MKKAISLLSCGLLAITLVFVSCKKDNDDDGATKAQLLAQSSWKFDKATASILGDISEEIDECIKDNSVTFTVTGENAGTGVLNEGDTKCDPSHPQTVDFTWTLQNNGTKLVTSVPLFDGGSTDFTIITLNSSSLVVSQDMTIDPYPTTTITVYFKH